MRSFCKFLRAGGACVWGLSWRGSNWPQNCARMKQAPWPVSGMAIEVRIARAERYGMGGRRPQDVYTGEAAQLDAYGAAGQGGRGRAVTPAAVSHLCHRRMPASGPERFGRTFTIGRGFSRIPTVGYARLQAAPPIGHG